MSDGEVLASAQAARGKDFAPAFGLHALAETVRARAFQSLGLVDSLDHKTLLSLKDSGAHYTLNGAKCQIGWRIAEGGLSPILFSAPHRGIIRSSIAS